MRKRTEYQSKVTFDTGLSRSRVPAPILKAIGARPADYLIFRLASTGEAIMRLARAVKKPVKGKRK